VQENKKKQSRAKQQVKQKQVSNNVETVVWSARERKWSPKAIKEKNNHVCGKWLLTCCAGSWHRAGKFVPNTVHFFFVFFDGMVFVRCMVCAWRKLLNRSWALITHTFIAMTAERGLIRQGQG
jgi:hypothetical protein